MSVAIKITGKTNTVVDGENLCTISFGAYDNTTPINDAIFAQTESLTEACGGITEYGMLVFNTENSDLESNVTIACVAGGSTVEATTSLGTLLTDSDVGDALG